MRLSPQEQDKLMIFLAAQLAERRKARGLKLNYPEAVAYLTFAILEGARDGKTVAQLMSDGLKILTCEDVMDGVPEMITEIEVEATFPDGTKLVTVHSPIRQRKDAESFKVGQYFFPDGELDLNGVVDVVTLSVENTADRPVQVGSHCHFFEVNRALKFNREQAYGRRLNIPCGTTTRFEPGQSHLVELVPFGGARVVFGFNRLVEGALDDADIKAQALMKVKEFCEPE